MLTRVSRERIRMATWAWVLVAVVVLYSIVKWAAGGLGVGHVAIGALVIILVFWSEKTRDFIKEAVPFLLFAVGYDLLRYPRAKLVTSERVLGCEVRSLEAMVFPAGQGRTWPEFFREHQAAWFDVVAAIPYFIYILVVVGYAAYLYFRDRPRMRCFLWSFTVANFLGFFLWLALPVAPPWYVAGHGCAIDAGALPSAAGLARIDELLGIQYFSSFYSRSAAVFGAMPSLHCAYPMIGLLTAWKNAGWQTRPVHIAYVLLMAVAAVYLQHHWVLDVFAGWLVALASVLGVSWAFRSARGLLWCPAMVEVKAKR